MSGGNGKDPTAKPGAATMDLDTIEAAGKIAAAGGTAGGVAWKIAQAFSRRREKRTRAIAREEVSVLRVEIGEQISEIHETIRGIPAEVVDLITKAKQL